MSDEGYKSDHHLPLEILFEIVDIAVLRFPTHEVFGLWGTNGMLISILTWLRLNRLRNATRDHRTSSREDSVQTAGQRTHEMGLCSALSEGQILAPRI